MHNIIRDFKIDYNTKLHEDDFTSVKLWVEESRKHEDCPVLYFKNQGDEDPENILEKNDFALILMTNFQKHMACKLASQKVCIDGTHGLNAYDFQLHSIVTVDEYHNGVPIAYMFSNRSDETVMTLYFNEVKKACGLIETQVFMSDDAPAYYNAWKKVMGPAVHVLLCTWHVLKSWKNNLGKIKNPSKASVVYKTLKVLLKETKEEKFNIELKNILLELKKDPDTELFGEYFEKYYKHRVQLWAYCFRMHLGINTNMFLEALHKEIKYSYLDGKKVKRLDKSINAILKLTRDKLFKRIIKISKHCRPARLKNIEASHVKSCTISLDGIKKLNEDEWLVPSSKNKENFYTVNKSEESCSLTLCPLQCTPCKICVHSYKCDCNDNVIKLNICKHIHAVVFLLQHESLSNEESVAHQDLSMMENINASNEEMVNTLIASFPVKKKPKSGQEKLISKVETILEIVTCETLEPDKIPQLEKIADRFLSCAASTKRFIDKENVCPRSKIEKQKRKFCSTKKKYRSNCKNTIKNPTYQEEKVIKEALLNPGKEVLLIHNEDDHMY